MSGPGLGEPRPVPPGQRLRQGLTPLHYGPVPHSDLSTWSLQIGGYTDSGKGFAISYAELQALPTVTVRADHHCVAKMSVQGLAWTGVAASTLLALAPPAPYVEQVLLSAEYGYSSNVRLSDLESAGAVFAWELDGAPLTPEHGWPLRLVLPHLYGFKGPKWVRTMDYLDHPQRGFWEQRGYHFTADAWAEQRYSHQE